MRGALQFFVSLLLVFIASYALIRYIFDLSGWYFYIELIVLLGVLLFVFIGLLLAYNRISAGYGILAIMSIIILANLLLFHFKKGLSTVLFTALIASLTTFVISIMGLGERKTKKSVPKVTTYTPGKVVSSKFSNYYHFPNSEWAKKIKKSNQVWFDSEDEAKQAGLKPHSSAK